MNSKIQSEHTFNHETEESRLPTNNPEYNAALYDWQKYTGDQQIGAFLNNPDNKATEAAIDGMTPAIEGAPGPAKIKETFSSSVLELGGTESVGGTDETATPL